MKRNFATVLNNFDGTPMKSPKGEDLTLNAVCMEALGAMLPGDADQPGTERMRVFQLASTIHAAAVKDEPAEVTPEDIILLKARIARTWSTFAVGAAFTLLDTDFTEFKNNTAVNNAAAPGIVVR